MSTLPTTSCTISIEPKFDGKMSAPERTKLVQSAELSIWWKTFDPDAYEKGQSHLFCYSSHYNNLSLTQRTQWKVPSSASDLRVSLLRNVIVSAEGRATRVKDTWNVTPGNSYQLKILPINPFEPGNIQVEFSKTS